ncbi:MAG: hypothetical protein LBG72_04560 [Spirochaetaceae bacterium]|jgi:hypothetical protein|nr:hypothetical protein [Spirochaetaceae bacterium]
MVARHISHVVPAPGWIAVSDADLETPGVFNAAAGSELTLSPALSLNGLILIPGDGSKNTASSGIAGHSGVVIVRFFRTP